MTNLDKLGLIASIGFTLVWVSGGVLVWAIIVRALLKYIA